MNSNKTILTLLLIIGILGALLGVQRWASSRSGNNSQAYRKHFESFNQEDVVEIKLATAAAALSFKKTENQWFNDQARIDASVVNELLTSLVSPTEITLISQNSEQHDVYEVTPEKATVVTLIASNGEKKLLVGSPASGNEYVRFDGTSEVWGVESIPEQIADLSLEDWLDKKLLAVDEQHISTLIIEKSGDQMTLQQREGKWFIDGGEQPLDRSAFSDLLMQLESLMAIGTIAEASREDFPAQPTLKLTVNTQGSAPVSLELFTGKDTIMAKLSDRVGNFEISQSTFDDLNLSRSQIQFAPQPTPTQE